MFHIRKGSVKEALIVADSVPELDHSIGFQSIEERINGSRHLLLIAERADQPIGFFIAFESKPNVLTSWMGGVLPEYRQQGVANKMLAAMENWARDNRFIKLEMKSYNRLTDMNLVLFKHHFQVTNLVKRTSISDSKLYFEKSLCQPM